MGAHVANFNVHGLFSFRVTSVHQATLDIFKSKFYYFLSDPVNVFDVDIYLGPWNIPHKCIRMEAKESLIGDGFVAFNDHYKILKWKLLLDGLEGDVWVVKCDSSLKVGYEAFVTKVLRPLFALKMALMGNNLLHASSVSCQDKGYVFCSLPGVGKSSLSFSLIDDRISFLGDENALVDSHGYIHPFLLSVPVNTFTLNLLNKKASLKLREMIELKLGDFIQFVSRGFFEKSFAFKPSSCFDVPGRTALNTVFVLSKSKDEFYIKDMNSEDGANKLAYISWYELAAVNKYLSHYFLFNPNSILVKRWDMIYNNYLKMLKGKRVLFVNLCRNNMTDSFAAIKKYLLESHD